MRIVVLMDGRGLLSNVVMSDLVQDPDIKIVGIVKQCGVSLKGWRRILRKLFQDAGFRMSLSLMWLLARLELSQIYKMLFHTNRRVLRPEEISRRYQIPLFNIDGVNSPQSLEIITDLQPDLILTNLFDQIVKEKLLAIPTKGTINIHLGLLPKYRGRYPYFWAMLHKEKITGVTVHWVNKMVDRGKILATKTIKITHADSLLDVAVKSARTGSALLKETIKKIKRGEESISSGFGKEDYYPFPTATALKKFWASGRKLGTWSKLINYL